MAETDNLPSIDPIFCVHCGNEVDYSDQYCSACGAEVDIIQSLSKMEERAPELEGDKVEYAGVGTRWLARLLDNFILFWGFQLLELL